MPIPSLAVDWRHSDSELDRLNSLLSSLASLIPAHRKLVAEIALVRLFLLTENTIQSIAGKTLCGATYLDATSPKRLVAARSLTHSFELMRTHGRAKPLRGLGWNKSAEIRENLAFTLDANDPLFLIVSTHGALLADMRYIRNHIAHKNSGTRINFQKVIKKRYGGLKRGLTPGGLLLAASTPGARPLLADYIGSVRILLKELVRT